MVHIDLSPDGPKQILRHCTSAEIVTEAKHIFEADDRALSSGKLYEGRQYAVYSFWRSLKSIKGDPPVLCDPNSIDEKRDFVDLFLLNIPGFLRIILLR